MMRGLEKENYRELLSPLNPVQSICLERTLFGYFELFFIKILGNEMKKEQELKYDFVYCFHGAFENVSINN